MSCKQCARDSKHHPSFNHSLNYGPQYYSEVSPECEEEDEEPTSPTLSLGNRILWLTEAFAASGIVRWIGRIPSVSRDWTAGVEFDNAMPDGGNGNYRSRSFFNSRPGHSLFLPVSELLKVDDPSNHSERTSFFGRLQDSCSNFAHRRRRDSTFGHFKQECYSTCAQNEFHCNSHYYSHAPVYDRITSRRSLRYDDHPYETYNNGEPLMNGRNDRVQNRARNDQFRGQPDDRIERLGFDDRIQHAGYPEEDGRLERRDSFFPNLKLISGFKEWVSCLLQGTTKRRKNKKIVLKDRKSVTSVFLQSLTGQRLSSFSEYASVSVARTSENTQDSSAEYQNRTGNQRKNSTEESRRNRRTRTLTIVDLPDDEPTDNVGESQNSAENQKKHVQEFSGKSLKRVGSQRIQHLTTLDYPDEPEDPPKEHQDRVVNKRIQRVTTLDYSDKPEDVPKLHQDKVANKRIQYVTSTGRVLDSYEGARIKESGNSVTGQRKKESGNYATGQRIKESGNSVTGQRKKSSKKRPAPLPPNQVTRNVSQDGQKFVSTKTVKSTSLVSMPAKKKYKKKRAPLPPVPATIYASVHKHKNPQDGSSNYDNLNFRQLKHKRKPMHRQLRRMPDISSLVNKSSGDSSSADISDDDSADEKFGLVKYRGGDTSNFVQYKDNNNDVCLKISIQKTETNVVTVEEVSPQRTVHYTIEEDTSSSSEEFSDEPPSVPVKLKAIAGPPNEEPTDTSTEEEKKEDSSLTEEEKSKTIFDDLQIEPPVKGSVKDFVNAFNMLATKGNVDSGQAKNIQSFPTKWEFQNKFLLPIAEESVNETSDKDGNTEDDLSDGRIKKNLTRHHSQTKHKAGTSKETTNYDPDKELRTKDSTRPLLGAEKYSEEKCSHCSEKHAPSPSLKKCPKKKRAAPKSEYKEQAHVTALSSLLKRNTLNDVPNTSVKQDSKLDQPIMVSLYIEDKSSHRGPMPLLITPSMTLRKLKKQVEAEYSLSRQHQCWILGQAFAVNDDLTLSSYGIKEAGSPLLLYVMSPQSSSSTLPNARTTAKEGTSREEGEKGQQHRSLKTKKQTGRNEPEKTTASKKEITQKNKESKYEKNKNPFHRAWEDEYEKKADYRTLVALDDVDLVSNVEPFECPVCFLDVGPTEGAVLQECLHSFCRECLGSAVQYSDTAIIKCPFANDEYSCESHLQEREIKCLVSPEIYEKHLARSVALAESQARDSFHCKTPDCPGWCLYEDNVNTFDCPVCKRTNCLTCGAVHMGRNCRQYQDWLGLQSDTSEEARKTREYLREMVESGEAMECPMCQVILMKKWGCDWLKCSMCHAEVCWVTKGPRWGPGGRGDTSGGCKCMLNGVRCHPKCSYCH